MKKRLFLMLTVMMVVLVSFASFYICEARADTGTDIRIVTVKVVADEEFRLFYWPDWKNYAKEVVKGASQELEKEYGVRLVIKEFEEWNPESTGIDLWSAIHISPGILRSANVMNSMDMLAHELEKGISPTEDIVIAFTGRGTFGGKKGVLNRRYILIMDTAATFEWWQRILEREGWKGWREVVEQHFKEKEPITINTSQFVCQLVLIQAVHALDLNRECLK